MKEVYKGATIIPITEKSHELFVDDKIISVDDLPIDDLKNRYCYIMNVDVAKKILNAESPYKQPKRIAEGTVKLFDFVTKLMKYDNTERYIGKGVWADTFSNGTYIKFRKILMDAGIITMLKNKVTKRYWVFKVHGIIYRIEIDELTNRNKLGIVILPTETPITTSVDVDQSAKRITDRSKKMLSTLKNIDIHFEQALGAELEYYDKVHYNPIKLVTRFQNLLSFYRERWIMKGPLSGRLMTNLCYLSRIARPYLHVYGKPFYYIDIVSAQPTFLLKFLSTHKNQFYDYTVDDEYRKAIEDGDLYDRFVSDERMDFRKYIKKGSKIKGVRRTSKTLNRQTIKSEFFNALLFHFKEYNAINKLFKEHFPMTWKSLKQYNKVEKQSLAASLQQEESELFNNLKVKYSRGYFLLFDSIYFTDLRDVEIIKEQIDSYFKKHNMKGAINVNSTKVKVG